MTLEQALLRIIQLQDEVAKLKEAANKPSIVVQPGSPLGIEHVQLPYLPTPWPSPTINLPYIQIMDCGPGGCQYPNAWFGIMPPSCIKCGKPSGLASGTITGSTTVTNAVIKQQEALTNIQATLDINDRIEKMGAGIRSKGRKEKPWHEDDI